jgi:hypothetical protein
MEGTQPEPSGVHMDTNLQPPENAPGNEGHANPPQTNSTPPPDNLNDDNNETPPSRATPQLKVKKTRAVLKIATLNIRGGGSAATQNKWRHMNQIMREKRIAILAIQETHLSEARVNLLNSQFNRRLKI